MHDGMYYWDGGWHMGWMGAWWLLGLVATMAIIWLLVNGGRRVGPPPESPDEILKRRYARGEISSDEYRRMRDELRA